jgi:CII-binding regulator of phage lambda lysogenization HflD
MRIFFVQLFIYCFNRKIFVICSQNKEEVNREALIQYLEAMIQLEHRRSSTDTNKIKSIANDIIKFHKRENNEGITKEEFISWYELRISTLQNELFINYLV